MDTNTLTLKQTAAFWRLFSAACKANAIPSADREPYRKRLLKETLGVEHMSQITRTAGFDRIMARLAREAGDSALAARYAIADDRRRAALAAECATQLLQLAASETSDPIPYISGILAQARLSPLRPSGPDWFLDLSPDALPTLLEILDTHRRRLLARLHPTLPRAFVYGRRYAFAPSPPALKIQLV